MSEGFNIITGLLAITEDTDDVVLTLHEARWALADMAKDYAEDALLIANSALSDAIDEALCVAVFAKIEDAREKIEKAQGGIEQADKLTLLICNAQKTGHDETDENLVLQQMREMRFEILHAIIDGAESRVSSCFEMMPDNPAPGSRCDPTGPTYAENYRPGRDMEDG